MRSGGLAGVFVGVLVDMLVDMGNALVGDLINDWLQASAGRCCADGSANAADAPNQSQPRGLKFPSKYA